MDRRRFLVTSLAGALAAPCAAEAQQAGKVYRVGAIFVVPAPPIVDAFVQSLREGGFVEGKNLVIEYRWSEGRSERLPEIAAELVRLNVDVIVTVTNAAALAAKTATSKIPIVMAVSSNPEQHGVVASLAKPGGSVTGLSIDTGPEIGGRMLQLLKEAVPKLSRVAITFSGGPAYNWADQSGTPARVIDVAARKLGLTLQPMMLRSLDDVASVVTALTDTRAEGLIVEPDSRTFVQRRLIIEYAAKQRVPAVYPFREFAQDGGLMAYGVDLKDLFRRAGTYVDKILKGAKPGDLPVEQPTKFELVINLKTAKALGLTIPPSLLLRADQVIE